MMKKLFSTKHFVVLLFLTFVGWMMYRIFLPNDIFGESAEEYIPGSTSVNYNGWQFFDYYLLMAYDKLQTYPLVDRAAFLMIIFNTVFSLVCIYMIVNVFRKRQKQDKRYFYFRNKYQQGLLDITNEERDLSESELEKILNWDEINLTDLDLQALLRVFRATRVKRKEVTNNNNILRVTNLMGLGNYIIKALTNGSIQEQTVVLLSVRQLQLHVPYSLVARLLNSHNRRLMTAARLQYLATNDEDPFMVLDKDWLNEHMTRFERMELHSTIHARFRRGKQMPSYKSLIDVSESTTIKAFLIKEAGYFGDIESMEYACGFLKSPIDELQLAAIEGIGIRKYAPAEQRLRDTYQLASTANRIAIIKSIGAISSGNADGFLLRAYGISKTHVVRRELLRCMWFYNTKSRQNFYKLKAEANDEYLGIFNYIETENS